MRCARLQSPRRRPGACGGCMVKDGARTSVRTAGVLPRLSPVGRSRATFIDCDAWLQINASRRRALNASAAFVANASSSGQLGGIATVDDDVSVPTNVRVCVAGRRLRAFDQKVAGGNTFAPAKSRLESLKVTTMLLFVPSSWKSDIAALIMIYGIRMYGICSSVNCRPKNAAHQKTASNIAFQADSLSGVRGLIV